jgi:hypothetical protein
MTPTVLVDIAVPENIIAQTHPPDGFVLRWMQQVRTGAQCHHIYILSSLLCSRSFACIAESSEATLSAAG